MDNLRIYGTSKTPDVNFNKTTLEFSGVSIPENALQFYEPIIDWMSKFVKESKTPSKLIFKLSYINTASLQSLYEILKLAETHNEMVIEWYYLSDDMDMRELGEDYQSAINVEILLKEVKAV